MDGLVTKTSEREKRVNKFQQDDSYHVFLLTTQVGGVGLTLTAADRVVIYDPSWNPATDAQAVDRIYRIGQKKRVMVYRLITCGAVEEKIYRRQVFKNSVIEQSTGQNKDPYRYFSRQELAELFVLDDVKSSATQQQLEGLHGHQRTFDDTLQRHVDNLHTFKMFGLSDHDLMFTRKPDDFDYEDEMATDLYNNKVEQAQNKLKVESDQLTGLEETDQRWGAFVGDRVKDDSPKFKDQEPVYPIEGISDKLEALSLPDYMKIKSEPTDFQQICNNKFSSSEFKKEEYQFQDIKLEGGGDVRVDDNFNTEEEKLNQASVDEEDFESDFLPAFDFKKDKMESSTPQAVPPIGDIITLNDSNGSFAGGPSPFKTLEESWVEKTSASTSNLRLSDDDDDDVIICGDSPVRNELTIPAPARARSPDVNDTDEDAVILAADSPLPDEKLNDLSDEEDESRGFLINTVEDSIRLFSESDDNDDEEGDSWKDVFAVNDSTPNTSVGLSAPTTSNRSTLSYNEETAEDESTDENSDGTELYSDEEYQDLVNSGAASFIFNISSDKEC
ncbi:unnamed protein product [Clavelina lepadiformis]|uniref:Helicase C-terminal domain-containing protein n=1 Tax=Clavelina lepadiformis TaxID=159417 RepID=A0ABP0GZA4_CLALP